MRTTLTIDEAVISELMQLTQAKSRNEAINIALSGWVNRRRIEKLMSLRGRVQIGNDLQERRQFEVAEAESLDT